MIADHPLVADSYANGHGESFGNFELINELVPDTVCGDNDMVFNLEMIT
jgi:hypothetical protein